MELPFEYCDAVINHMKPELVTAFNEEFKEWVCCTFFGAPMCTDSMFDDFERDMPTGFVAVRRLYFRSWILNAQNIVGNVLK